MNGTPKFGGTLVENSAIDLLLQGRLVDFQGPFMFTEHALAEKAAIPKRKYRECVEKLAQQAYLFACPPASQLIARTYKRGSILGPLRMDVPTAVAEQHEAARRMTAQKLELQEQLSRRHELLRPHFRDWLGRCDRGEGTETGKLLKNPPKPSDIQEVVMDLTVRHLGALPKEGSDASDWLRWHLNAWEGAMTFTRVQRERDRESDLRNDPIDAVQYALAATFCDRIVTCDRGMKTIYEGVPEPRGQLFYVQK